MDFKPTETQRLLSETCTRFARERFSFENRKGLFRLPPAEVKEDWSALAELGLCGLLIPEMYDGAGANLHDMAAALEALGGGMMIEPLMPSAVMAAGLLLEAGSEVQKRRYLSAIASGAVRAAVAHAEPRSRYRLHDVQTTAVRDGESFVLSGTKAVVLGGATAGVFIVAARVSGDRFDLDGVSLFAVERNAPGLEVSAYRNLDLTGGADLHLRDVRVLADALLGEWGKATPFLEHAADRGVAALCAEAVGAMSAVQQLTLTHIKQRHAFGQPLGAFQALQHRMADMVVACEQARSMAILAIDEADNPDPVARAKAISAAKVQVDQSGRFVGQQAMQMHGAMAITLEYPAGYYHKRLSVIEHQLGDVDYHLERFADASYI